MQLYSCAGCGDTVMMRDDAFAQWHEEMHRSYDPLQAGICVISADDQEKAIEALSQESVEQIDQAFLESL